LAGGRPIAEQFPKLLPDSRYRRRVDLEIHFPLQKSPFVRVAVRAALNRIPFNPPRKS
jgi:hypothetical protein